MIAPKRWTYKERSTLFRALHKGIDSAVDLMPLLPGRTSAAIYRMAKRHGFVVFGVVKTKPKPVLDFSAHNVRVKSGVPRRMQPEPQALGVGQMETNA